MLIVFITIITVSFAVCKVMPRPPLSLETSLLAWHPFQVEGCRFVQHAGESVVLYLSYSPWQSCPRECELSCKGVQAS